MAGKIESGQSTIRSSLQRINDVAQNIGTSDYPGKGGARLILDGTSESDRVDRAVQVGKIRKRIATQIVPLLELKLKVDEIQNLARDGYLPQEEAEIAQQALEGERKKRIKKSDIQLTPNVITTISEPDRVLAPAPKPPQYEELTSEEISKLAKINVWESTGRVEIDGRTVKYKNPTKNTAFKVLAHLLKNYAKTFTASDIEEYLLKELEVPKVDNVMINNIIYQLKVKIEIDPKNPKILRSRVRGGRHRVASYKIYAREINFITQDKATPSTPRPREQQESGRTNPTQSTSPDDDDNTHRNSIEDVADSQKLDGGKEENIDEEEDEDRNDPFADTARSRIREHSRTDEHRIQQIHLEQRQQLKMDLAISVLSLLTRNRQDITITANPVEFVRSKFRGIGVRGLSYANKVKALTGGNSPEELMNFFAKSFVEVLDKYWDLTEEDLSKFDKDGAQIIDYCQKLALGKIITTADTISTNEEVYTIKQTRGVSKAEVIREVFRHFGLSVPEGYACLTPDINLPIRLRTENESGKQRRRQPSHGKIKL